MKTYFSNNKWTVGIISLLVVLNLFTLSMLWFSNKGPERGDRNKRPHKRGQMDKFFAKKLSLSEDQKEQLKAFRRAHRQVVRGHIDQMDKLRKQRMDVLTQTSPDTAQLNDLASKIGVEQTEMENALSDHYFQLYSICNEEQKKELGKVFHELTKRRGPKGRDLKARKGK